MKKEHCQDHSGCVAEIENLKASDKEQWVCINYIKNRINMILGGVVLSLIALVGNFLIKLGVTP